MTQDLIEQIEGRDFFKRVAIEDRQFFHEYYLDTQRKLAWHQIEMFDFIDEVQRTTRRGLLLEPRGHTKSTIVSWSYVIQEICRNPNVRILLTQKTQKEAEKTVSQVSDALRGKIKDDFNLRFRKLQSHMFTLYRDRVAKEATLEGVGVGGAITGGHFDIIILDDVVDVKNSRTPGERQSVKDWMSGTLSLLIEPHTLVIYIATRKHFDDLTGELKANPAWKCLERKAILTMPDTFEYVYDEEGNATDVKNLTGNPRVLFPEKWDIKSLLLLKQQLGSIVFNREMQNEVLAEEDARFKMSWLRYFRWENEQAHPNKEQFPRVWKRRLTGVDLAISQSESADKFARVSIVVDHLHRIFVEPYDYLRIEFPEQAALLKAHMNSQKPWKCGVESNQYQLALIQHLNREMLRPFIPVKNTRNKEERIIGTLSPLFEAGKIFFHESYSELIEQYAQFGKAKHDDLMDALEIAVSLALASQNQINGKMTMRLI
jgi:predicted phage terminase large subunit-like protein